MADKTTEFIMVPVPREHYASVINALARAEFGHDVTGGQEQEGTGASPPPSASSDEDGAGDPRYWSPEDLAKLAGKTNKAVIATLDACSESPGEWIPGKAIRDRIGWPRDKQRAAYSGFARHINAKWDGRHWPMTPRWGLDLGLDAQTYYSVSEQIADAWQEAQKLR